MQRQPQRHYSVDEYFAVETGSPIKHEYYNGEIFAMAGASVAHNDITTAAAGSLVFRGQFQGVLGHGWSQHVSAEIPEPLALAGRDRDVESQE